MHLMLTITAGYYGLYRKLRFRERHVVFAAKSIVFLTIPQLLPFALLLLVNLKSFLLKVYLLAKY